MIAARRPRWATSFADLCLLLLAFFVMLHVAEGRGRAVLAGTRAALGGAAGGRALLLDAAADPLFESGEARLKAPARARLGALGRGAARGKGRIEVESAGRPQDAARFDGWELAAARAAALARAMEEGGLAAGRIDLVMPRGEPAMPHGGQHIRVRVQ